MASRTVIKVESRWIVCTVDRARRMKRKRWNGECGRVTFEAATGKNDGVGGTNEVDSKSSEEGV